MISIIIVSYNVPELLINCIESVENTGQTSNYEIIVVDNASKDNAKDIVLERFPKVVWIQNQQNLGFASAVNIGLMQAHGDIFVLLNPDSIMNSNALTALETFWQSHPDAGIVGGKVLNADGTIQKQCRRNFPSPSSAFFRLFRLSRLFPKCELANAYELDPVDLENIHEVDAVAGAFMSFTRDLVELIGMFDEGYFLMGEDLDFCYRAKLASKKVFFLPKAVITHYYGASRQTQPLKSTYHSHMAMIRYFRKFLKDDHSLISTGFIYAGIITHLLLFWFLNLILLAKQKLIYEKNQ
ncbi:MAG: glycosyltransferase family 2 protein [bacterium]